MSRILLIILFSISISNLSFGQSPYFGKDSILHELQLKFDGINQVQYKFRGEMNSIFSDSLTVREGEVTIQRDTNSRYGILFNFVDLAFNNQLVYDGDTIVYFIGTDGATLYSHKHHATETLIYGNTHSHYILIDFFKEPFYLSWLENDAVESFDVSEDTIKGVPVKNLNFKISDSPDMSNIYINYIVKVEDAFPLFFEYTASIDGIEIIERWELFDIVKPIKIDQTTFDVSRFFKPNYLIEEFIHPQDRE